MYKKRHIDFYSYVPYFFKYLVSDSSSPYSSANSAKCIYKTLFIKSCSKTLESPEKSGLPALHLFCSPFMAGAEGFEPSARGFGATVGET